MYTVHTCNNTLLGMWEMKNKHAELLFIIRLIEKKLVQLFVFLFWRYEDKTFQTTTLNFQFYFV